ncbi:hypothetical protein H7J07_03320 [Mycobacterium koreense]|uniref:Uncharacterized protein n=1 Tax=Mycolicibacillus koreensis TaxID=1069220 RepID=A0AA91SS11_9MYCO|nr:hypothetical protein [Mycolicibacillus koreensis]MCV7247288.1 hypothetical protein [Mycolicibacillus koreensis]ODR06706.1 hypothetical protein BHQ15_12835 [Mycolicibacillus koreensis]OSC34196.1 hypothetical protein B8W67_07575 [Mycolicibacillus koreensis]
MDTDSPLLVVGVALGLVAMSPLLGLWLFAPVGPLALAVVATLAAIRWKTALIVAEGCFVAALGGAVFVVCAAVLLASLH